MKKIVLLVLFIYMMANVQAQNDTNNIVRNNTNDTNNIIRNNTNDTHNIIRNNTNDTHNINGKKSKITIKIYRKQNYQIFEIMFFLSIIMVIIYILKRKDM